MLQKRNSKTLRLRTRRRSFPQFWKDDEEGMLNILRALKEGECEMASLTSDKKSEGNFGFSAKFMTSFWK
jgi:hypothetical protein